MFALRAAADEGEIAEATLWINVEQTEAEAVRRAGQEGDSPDPGAAWAALVRTGAVLDGLHFDDATTSQLTENLSTHMDANGQFMKLRLEWPEEGAADILDRLVERYVLVASDLKVKKLDEAVEVADQAVWAVEAELLAAAEEGSPERIEAAEAFHAAMRGRLEAARLARSSFIPDVRVLDQARVVR